MVATTIRIESCSHYRIRARTRGVSGGRTHGDRILNLDLRPLVSGEATPVCDVLQHCSVRVLLLAVNNRQGEPEGCLRVAGKCDVGRFTAADFDTCQGVPGLCTTKYFVQRLDDSCGSIDDEPDLLEACGEEVGISDAEEWLDKDMQVVGRLPT